MTRQAAERAGRTIIIGAVITALVAIASAVDRAQDGPPLAKVHAAPCALETMTP